MAIEKQPASEHIYQIKVTLKGSKPPIWRRFQVPGNITFHRLHLILQVVMGWTNSHLYRFEIQGTQFGEPDPENSFYGMKMKNSHTARLSKVISHEKVKFLYEYDFGDSWQHELLIEKILPVEPGTQYPVCFKGKRACPPEDCGGIWGYAHLLEVMRDPLDEEHEEIMEWLGGEFDPEEFDLSEINEELKGYSAPETAKAKRKTGRNDPCPCGSGKKYKYCCGREAGTKSSSNQKLSTGDFRAMRRLMERDLRSLQKMVEEQNFETEEEADAFLQQVTRKGQIPEWIPETPLEKAQELIYQAWETTDRKERIRLAKEALRVCQDCADAYIVLAEEAARTPEEARNWYQRGVEAGEHALGPEVFANEAGNFWGLVETRPYMRAREGLADCLSFLGEHNAAIQHYRDMLRLNPNDNQGIRYKLLNSLMEVNDIDGTEELLQQFHDETSTVWLFTRALVSFIRQGDSTRARTLLKDAIKQNAHVVAYLLEQERLPRTIPEYISLGGKDEAAGYVTEFARHWVNTPGALQWLKTVVEKNHSLER
jgi:tetratricopeptide (TPR) repeat protein